MRSQRANKYSARKTVYLGVVFDSKGEAERARHLDLLRAGGVIAAWGRAEPIVLIPARGKWGVTYTPDFRVWGHQQHGDYLEEFKGMETEAWKLRLKLLRYLRPDTRLLIVKADGSERWAW